MAKQNAKVGGELATSPLANTVRSAVAPTPVLPTEKAAPDSSDDLGTFSAAEKAFLDGLAQHRDAFSAEAVEGRSNSKLKSS